MTDNMIEKTAIAAVKQGPKSGILINLNNLEAELCKLREEIYVLANKLDPVKLPVPTAAHGENMSRDSDPGSSNLASTLSDRLEDVRYLYHFVRELTSTVDL